MTKRKMILPIVVFCIMLLSLIALSVSQDNSSPSPKSKKIDKGKKVTKIDKSIDYTKPISLGNGGINYSTPEIKLAQVSDVSKLDRTRKNWFFMPKPKGTPSEEPKDVLDMIHKYSGYYLGDTSNKIIYLTFDEGYEYGNTPKFLDTLKANNVKATFFVTAPYVNSDKDYVKRMVDEGHLVGNHTTHHYPMSSITDESKFDYELNNCASLFKEVTGKEMAKFFRPPEGAYSELSLYYAQKLGYRTIFWSSAYEDWDPKHQPDPQSALHLLINRTHPGGIYLLHAESNTNAQILDSLIKDWKSQGYVFKTLDKLPAY